MMISKNVLQNMLGNLSLSDLVPKSAKPTEDIPPIRPDVDYRTVLLTLSAFSLRLNLAARTAVDASYKRLFDSRLATLARGDRRKSAEWLRVVFLQTAPFNLSTPNRRCTKFQYGLLGEDQSMRCRPWSRWDRTGEQSLSLRLQSVHE